MTESFKKYLVELFGTFFLVLTIACTVLLGSNHTVAPFAVASIYMVMVYAGINISGGHFNPAVSLAAAIKGTISWDQFLPYVLFQLIGSVLAVYAFNGMAGNSITMVEPASFDTLGLLIAESIFTFALCYVALMTTDFEANEKNSYFGFAMGFTILVGAFAVGGTLSAAAFNPAVALSVGMLGITTTQIVGTTILANLIGGICAACFVRYLNNNEE